MATSIHVIKGAPDIRRMFSNLIANSQANLIVGVSNVDDLEDAFPEYEFSGTPARLAAGIKGKLIYYSSKGPFLASSDAINDRRSLFIKNPLHIDFSVVGDCVVLLVVQPGDNPQAVLIESPTIAAGYRQMFDLLWDNTPKSA